MQFEKSLAKQDKQQQILDLTRSFNPTPVENACLNWLTPTIKTIWGLSKNIFALHDHTFIGGDCPALKELQTLRSLYLSAGNMVEHPLCC